MFNQPRISHFVAHASTAIFAMKGLSTLILFGSPCLLVFSIPLRYMHLRQLPPAVQITWVTSSTTVSLEATTTTFEIVTIVSSGSSPTSDQPDGMQTPFLWAPPLPLPSSPDPVSVSIATEFETLSEILTSTVYEQPTTVTLTATPTTVTDTITVSDTFTATPGSFWSAPAQFSNLDSFKIAHFACGEQNLQVTKGVPPNASDGSLATNLESVGDDMKASYGQGDLANSSSVLQLLYPADSINPGNSPQGGADFYATPLPLADASNVTLEYSVFFPVGFDWVQGGKLPGLYGGHMTCSGGDDATSCFSTRLMWRAGGEGELYLYAPKDKQTSALCHAPPQSVCDAAYGLSVGRGSFSFTPGAWTNVRQTVTLNEPGEQDGGFRLEVNGQLIMDRHDVFYRENPPTTSSSASAAPTNAGGDADADDGGLLSPLLGGVLSPLHSVGVNEGILPPVGKDIDPSTSTAVNFSYPIADRPPLLPFQEPYTEVPTTDDAASALIYNLTASRSGMVATALVRPTITQAAPQPTVTIANYLWAHAFNSAGKEMSISSLSDSGPKPIAFSGLFFSTFFGGSSDEYATPTDQYSWFKDFAITINS